MGDWAQISDDALVTRLQRAAFCYLIDYANEDIGFVADTSRRIVSLDVELPPQSVAAVTLEFAVAS